MVTLWDELRDSALYFHLGNRLLHNDFPYRDYVFQVGFIPIIIFDAFFQNILGQSYYASLFAAFIVKATNLLVYYFIFRQFSSQVISVALCSGFALMNSSLVHWSTSYVYLFLSISALFIILGLNKLEKGSSTLSFLYIAISGFSLALVIGARQSNGTLCILVTLGVILIYSLRSPKKIFTYSNYSFYFRFSIRFRSISFILSSESSTSPSLSTTFLDASEKKRVGGFAALIDVFLGGLKFDSSIKEIIKVVVIPILLSAIVFKLIQYPIKANSKYNVNLIGILLLPSLLLIGISISLIDHLINTHNLPTIIASTAFIHLRFTKYIL
ncbi:MAG: hypothetical protein N4J56_005208 [Chroococcidiopsis sp. SAG 2025]|uniref:hypothetical protein n=1 Tax=Chroococcidiopsis sp. SAG 2025 TaxID=171389 RepID=UPI0029372180|nr:hypothetical protein [Chroococcidiopsis sp. SAG 2025]MDV2995554.1 hypothetical protein [Chroococcidiopsis sp. SAG 2025]